MRVRIVITTAFAVAPIMVPYLTGIGLSQSQIGISQAAFMLAAFCFDIPAGWLADKTSRMKCAMAADILMALCFLAYTQVQSFLHVLLIEIVLGIGASFINGADDGLVAAYCERLNRSMAKELMLQTRLTSIAAICLLSIAGLIAATAGFKWTFIFGAMPLIIGAVITMLLADIAPAKTSFSSRKDIRTAIREMGGVIRTVMTMPQLRWTVFAGATSIQMCRTLFIVQTPLLLLAGVPLWMIGFAWAAQQVAVWVGTKLAERKLFVWNIQQLFIVPVIFSLGAMVLLATHVNGWTIVLYGVIAVAGGWSSAIARPIFNHQVPAQDIMATAASVRTSVYMVFYIVGVLVVGFAGNFGVQWALLANAVFFLPLAALCMLYVPKYRLPSEA